MFEACTVEAAKAVHETLKVRAEEQQPQQQPAAEPEPEPEPDMVQAGSELSPPEGVPPVPSVPQNQTVVQWLEDSGLGKCTGALEDYVEVIDLQEADGDELPELFAAVAAAVSKPVLRRFKRELAGLRGRGESFA